MGIKSYSNIFSGNRNVTEVVYDNEFRLTTRFGSGTGGTLVTSGNASYNVFTSPGTFTITSEGFFEFLVIGGGGGGGTGTGGGGGSGGLVYSPSFYISSPVAITIGSGAAPASHPNTSSNGNPTTFVGAFGTITASGGGRGSSGGPVGSVNASSPGGSGGGGSAYTGPPYGNAASPGIQPTQNPGISILQYGFDGGSSPYGGGGGGGAGTNGLNGPGGVGGAGRAFPNFPAPVIAPAIPAPVRPSWSSAVGPTGLFCGGGAGSSGSDGVPGGSGGGGTSNSASGTPGIEYTGSGGGANWTYSPGAPAGGGGSGIVIVRYLT